MSNPAARTTTWSFALAVVALLVGLVPTLAPTAAYAASMEAPSGLEASEATTSTAITLTWRTVVGAPAYRLQYSTSSKMKKASYQRDAGTTGTLEGLKPAKTYYVRVRVISSSGDNLSRYSDAVKVKTLAEDPVAACTLTPTAPRTRLDLPAHPNVLLLGDSYTEGVGAVPLTNGYAYHFAGLLGWTLTRDGRGGSGYVNPTTYGAGTFADRLSGHPADGYDLVVLQGSSNDMRYGSDQLDCSLITALGVLRERYPHAQVLMIGPTNPYGDPSPDLVRVNDEVKAAAAAYGAPFIDPIAERWFSPGDGQWAANPANAHLSNAGHRMFAARLVADVLAIS